MNVNPFSVFILCVLFGKIVFLIMNTVQIKFLKTPLLFQPCACTQIALCIQLSLENDYVLYGNLLCCSLIIL